MMVRQIFISYSRVDTEKAEWLINRLKRSFPDATIWYDKHLKGRGGQNWWNTILDAIEESDIFLFLLSNESLASEYCQAEFTESQRLKRPFIAVQLRDRTKIPASLSDYQYVDLVERGSTEDPYDDLVGSIQWLWEGGARAKQKRFSKKQRTPKPGNVEETVQASSRADMETLPLVVPELVSASASRQQYIIAAIGAIAVIVAAIITILPSILARQDNLQSTETVQASLQVAQHTTAVGTDDARSTGVANALATLTALAPTDTPTITPTPTDTPISSSDIQNTAMAETFGEATIAALTQTAIAQLTQSSVETQQFIAGETATYIFQLSLTPLATDTLNPSPIVPTNTPNSTATASIQAPSVSPTVPLSSPTPVQLVYENGYVIDDAGNQLFPIEVDAYFGANLRVSTDNLYLAVCGDGIYDIEQREKIIDISGSRRNCRFYEDLFYSQADGLYRVSSRTKLISIGTDLQDITFSTNLSVAAVQVMCCGYRIYGIIGDEATRFCNIEPPLSPHHLRFTLDGNYLVLYYSEYYELPSCHFVGSLDIPTGTYGG
jgi:hypothetical protein